MTTRWRIERGYESIPAFAVEREDPPIGEPLFRLAERGVEHEFADGLAFSGRGCLQGLFSGPAQPKIKLFRPIGALGHFVTYADAYHNLPDNVTTIWASC